MMMMIKIFLLLTMTIAIALSFSSSPMTTSAEPINGLGLFMNDHQPLSAIRDMRAYQQGEEERFFGEDGNSYSTERAFEIKIEAASAEVAGDSPKMSVTITCSRTNLLENSSRTDYTEDTLRRHWVGLYSPANANVSETAPVKYAVVFNRNSAYPFSGIGGIEFRLHKMRGEYDFVLFAANDPESASSIYHKNFSDWGNILGSSKPIARTKVVNFTDDANKPTMPRVGVCELCPENNKISITWTSGRGSEAKPKLRWRFVNETSWRPYTYYATKTTTVKRESLCGQPANAFGWRDPGFHHYVEITNDDVTTKPKRRYFEYQIADDLIAFDSSQTYVGKFLPEIGSDHTTLALFADMGVGTDDESETWREYGQPGLNVAESIGRASANTEHHPIDAAFLFGDLSYAVGYLSVWDEFLHQMSSQFASKIPFLVNSGNHELDYFESGWNEHNPNRTQDLYGGHDSGGECGVMAMSLFNTPRKSFEKDWFGTAIGNIFIVSINTEIDFSLQSTQYADLKKIFEEDVDRTKTPWLIVVGHRPGVIDSSYAAPEDPKPLNKKDSSDIGTMKEIQETLWPLFVKEKVDLTFWGHNHAYQRSCSLKSQIAENAICDLKSKKVNSFENAYEAPKYPISLVVGTAGAQFTKHDIGMFFTEKVIYEHGFVNLHAHNSTHLYGKFIDSVNADAVLDSFWIIRDDDYYGNNNDQGKESRTAAIFFTVMCFLATFSAIAYYVYKRRGGTLSIFRGLGGGGRDASRPSSSRFLPFNDEQDEDEDREGDFPMSSLREKYNNSTTETTTINDDNKNNYINNSNSSV
jgi:acid phosphatase type 7